MSFCITNLIYSRKHSDYLRVQMFYFLLQLCSLFEYNSYEKSIRIDLLYIRFHLNGETYYIVEREYTLKVPLKSNNFYFFTVYTNIHINFII